MSTPKLVLEPFRRSLLSLDEALSITPVEDIVRDGTIQRFEYTYELAWKMIQWHFQWRGDTGMGSMARKDVFREAPRHSLIEDPVRWFNYNEARNSTSHDYSRSKADKTYELIKEFSKDAHFLLEQLESFHA